MGLDMYLERAPRIEGISANNILAYESWIGYQRYLERPFREDEDRKYTFKEWCGSIADYLPNDEQKEVLKPYISKKYSFWDTDHNYPYWEIKEEVAYWRKANAIHKWFVENIQDGEDDCDYHNEVTKEDLEELLDICHEVICANSSEVSERLLPTESGFFFGGTEYDEYYYKELEDTIDMLKKVLEETDFDTQAIYYISSW